MKIKQNTLVTNETAKEERKQDNGRRFPTATTPMQPHNGMGQKEVYSLNFNGF